MSSALHSAPNLEDLVSVFMCSSDRVGQLHPQTSGSLFVAFYDSQSYSGGILTLIHTGAVQGIQVAYIQFPVCILHKLGIRLELSNFRLSHEYLKQPSYIATSFIAQNKSRDTVHSLQAYNPSNSRP
jgi:hypothetical protein